MATVTQVSASEYLRTGYEPDAGYVDGEIEQRAAGLFDHAVWQSAIQASFFPQQARWGVLALAAQRIQASESRFRVADVTVVDRSLPREQIITRLPVAVFEVLSPEDRVPRMIRKRWDDARMGIRNILVVDPGDGSVWKFEHGELAPGESGPLAGSPCVLDGEQIRKYVAGE